jgi:hypothetical protein
MAALAQQRRLMNLIDGLILSMEHPCKATQVFHKGAFVALDATGYLVPMAATPGLRAAGAVDTGRDAKVDTTGQSDGQTILKVQAAIWNAVNHATDPVTQADMLKLVYFADDQTVAKTDGGVGRPVAGIAVKFEGTQVMVAIGFPFGGGESAQLGGSAPGAANTVTSGAIGLTRSSKLSVTGTQAFTLANGTQVGQRKTLRQTVAASTPNGTVTLVGNGFTTLTGWDALNDSAELEWTGTAWDAVFLSGVTAA